MLTSVFGPLSEGVSWFPQQYANAFFALQGVTSLLAVVLLLAHMHVAWRQDMDEGQRLRYITLLACAVLFTGGSVEQIGESAPVAYRHLGVVSCALLLLVAMVVSLREDYHRNRKK